MMTTCGMTHVGRVRKENQDAFLVDDARHVFILADGMGGHKGGGLASGLAQMAAHEALSGSGTPRNRTAAAFAMANVLVFRESMADKSVRGMGTTLVTLIVNGNEATIGHMGDSRCYLMRNGTLIQLTEDHALGHALTRAIGISPLANPDIQTRKLVRGDWLLLCSDGLTNEVWDEQIEMILASKRTAKSACTALIQTALEQGGKDNVTVIVVRME